ncbi:hypothetical protein DV735_g24, partial [Chaetothyriales sp. CBS 134920]
MPDRFNPFNPFNPHRGLASAAAVEQLETNGPDQLARQSGDQGHNTPLYSPPPPPTPVTSPSERKVAPYKATPMNQFQSQSRRERQRLEHQRAEKGSGRRQTLPWDDACSLDTNSENNVRSRWIEQGIWADEWGPAWPKRKDGHAMTSTWGHFRTGPFFSGYSPHRPLSVPGACWGHEKVEFEPTSVLESEESEAESSLQPAGQPSRVKKPGGRGPPRATVRYGMSLFGLMPQYLTRVTVRNPEASRPYYQFLYQMSKERDWIKDELDHKVPGTIADLDTMAYQRVKANWIQDQIWDYRWVNLPGMSHPQRPTQTVSPNREVV